MWTITEIYHKMPETHYWQVFLTCDDHDPRPYFCGECRGTIEHWLT